MKKIYFFGALMSLMMLVSLPVSAAVSSISDLYGKYKFSAKLNVTKAGESLTENFAAESDVVFTKSSSEHYEADITGIAGAVNGPHRVSGIDTEKKTITIANWNGVNASLWNGNLWMSDTEGTNPWASPLPDLVLTYDDNGTITIPDFTLVSLADFSAAKGTIAATFTECKLTLVEKENANIVDLSGNWHVTANNTNSNSTLPAEYDFVLAKTSEDNKNYTMDITVAGLQPVKLNATFDGEQLVAVMDSVVFDAEQKIVAADFNASYHTKLAFEYESETVLKISNSNFLCLVPNGEFKSAQWYSDGKAEKSNGNGGGDGEAFDWAGSWTVTIDNPTSLYIDPNFANAGFPTSTFDMVITYDEAKGIYRLMEFLGFNDIYASNYNAGIPLTPTADDPNVAELTTYNSNFGSNMFLHTISGGVFYAIADGNGGNGTVKFTKQDDGTILIGDFFVKYIDYINGNGSAVNAAFYGYTNKTAVKKNDTAINNIAAPANTGAEGIYTLSGVRVGNNKADFNALPGGIYIIKSGQKSVKVVR